jgi:hypothetical protein
MLQLFLHLGPQRYSRRGALIGRTMLKILTLEIVLNRCGELMGVAVGAKLFCLLGDTRKFCAYVPLAAAVSRQPARCSGDSVALPES